MRTPFRCWGIILVCVLSVSTALAADAPTGRRVLVVFSTSSKESKQIANYYVQKRSVPETNLCPISGLGNATESLEYRDFEPKVLRKVTACLDKAGKSDILYIVLTLGFPFKLISAPEGYGQALDQYLNEPYSQYGGSRTNNPYSVLNDPKGNRYGPFQSLADFRASHPSEFLYSVWRLDAPSAKIAMDLVDKAIATEKNGPKGIACFDRRYGPSIEQEPAVGLPANDWRLLRAAEFARKAGIEVVEDDHLEEFGTPPAPKRCSNAFLYAGWYSLVNYNDAFDWAEGAIGLHQDSGSCMNPRTGKSWCTTALARGITVTAGAVIEPYLEGLPKPDGVVFDLLRGATVGDALLRNTAWLKWQIINIGDPLYVPFSAAPAKSRPAIHGKQ